MINDSVLEVEGGHIRIVGNAITWGNYIYSASNILSVSFDSIRRERLAPEIIEASKEVTIFFFKIVLIFTLVITIFISSSMFLDVSVSENFSELRIIFSSLVGVTSVITIIFFIIWQVSNLIYQLKRFYWVYGFTITFITGHSLMFKTKKHKKFVDQTLSYFHEIISNGLIDKQININFNENKINIKKSVNSTIVGGNVDGNLGDAKHE